ncbi:hypothetical protein TUN199_05981 [Pyrenophora tritici-repentis]|uniref:Uncharacterized protein n=1 Tax=Pyrenophora tritici-repentis TaxID=45151 RepID=A0A5M9KZU1_9PLEO|nr:hypothetical protein PtrV1_09826 [Pyrenophora tritici-repentis]KAF7445780.1 hypothetical protein A1F99_090710 [Pyrenophora tritici-repentis]KAF7566907.1 hypothetical protein PtrM4_134980 [Pyrenophora tritici-repentis]KAI0573582.1 hypothetical protein Alg215_09111 [Pyrenophora tritici-repentis]KAI0588686.1 hypothetical protein Alg130_03298 [Pyrenophora tritici-repentis]
MVRIAALRNVTESVHGLPSALKAVIGAPANVNGETMSTSARGKTYITVYEAKGDVLLATT